jgi:hypothetical protein
MVEIIANEMCCVYCGKDIQLEEGQNVVTFKDTQIYYHADCYNRDWTEDLKYHGHNNNNNT